MIELEQLQQQLEITPQQHYDLLAQLNTDDVSQPAIHPIAPPLPRTLLKQGSTHQRTIMRKEKKPGE